MGEKKRVGRRSGWEGRLNRKGERVGRGIEQKGEMGGGGKI